jgi:DNA invertase Pin-like site-specific DNA recombinase
MVGQIVGYVRVSSTGQNTSRQVEALAGCDRLFTDELSGKNTQRPALTELVDYVREGDVVRVASMDRLARSLRDLLGLVTDFRDKGVTVEFLHERLTFAPNTDDHYAAFQLQVLGAVAELERNIIRERQSEGIAIAKAKGVYKGRKPALTPDRVQQAREAVAAGIPKAKVARDLGVSRQTLYSALNASG